MRDSASGPAWNGWGVDSSNARFQAARNAGITAAQVPALKLKWAFGFPGVRSVIGQPSVAAGRVFIGVDTGDVYSLDAATGCPYWSIRAEAGVRTAITISGGAQPRGYFGDLKANVYAVDASNGKTIWQAKVEDHPSARITGAPQLFEGRLYVPVARRVFNSGLRQARASGALLPLIPSGARCTSARATRIPNPPPRPPMPSSLLIWTRARFCGRCRIRRMTSGSRGAAARINPRIVRSSLGRITISVRLLCLSAWPTAPTS